MLSRIIHRLCALSPFKLMTAHVNAPPASKLCHIPLDTRMVWIDCEMTGLDPETNRIVEIACIVTNDNLDIMAELGPIVIKQPPEVMDQMSEWCKVTFAKNGLLERIKKSETTEKEAEDKIAKFLLKHVKKGECPIAGNTVYMDKLFINKYMPKVSNLLHYRMVDVSTIKELARRWYPLHDIPKKKMNHLALDDIRESINELKYYREKLFKSEIS